MVESPYLSCFVSAPLSAEITPLLQLLQRMGWTPRLLSDLAPLGAAISDATRTAIQSTDRSIIVLPNGPGATNAALEAGMALALNKPLVVIADPEADVPIGLAGVLIVRARPDNLEAIRFALDQLADRVPGQRHDRRSGSGRAIGSLADSYIERADHLSSQTEAVRLVIEVIEASGAAAVTAAGMDRGFDIGVWSDDLDAIGANPLLVEIKDQLRPEAVRQSLTALHSSPSARLALIVVVGQGHLDPATAGLAPPVLAVHLRTLLEGMRSRSFAEVVRDLRNRAVHGV